MVPSIFSQPFFLLKIALLILLFLYIIFAFVVFNQTRAMQQIVNQSPLSTILDLFAFIHFLLALSLFAYTLVIL